MKLKNLFAATALAASTTLSFASGPLTLNPTGPNKFGAVFTNPSGDGFFVDTFYFAALPSSSTVFVSLFGLGDPIQFLTAAIETDDLNPSQSVGFAPGQDLVKFQGTVGANTTFHLVVTGASTLLGVDGLPFGPVSYGGAVIAAVPEPDTYALLIAGLVGVGAAVRRTQRAASTTAA